MLFLFKKPDDLEIQIYIWNSADINFRIAQIIGSRKNITCLDYKRRNELDSFNLLHWSESKDLEFTSIGNSQNSGEVLERFTRVNFVGRLTFQKGIDRFAGRFNEAFSAGIADRKTPSAYLRFSIGHRLLWGGFWAINLYRKFAIGHGFFGGMHAGLGRCRG
jgi:hypothetical protein